MLDLAELASFHEQMKKTKYDEQAEGGEGEQAEEEGEQAEEEGTVFRSNAHGKEAM